jgi:hypothetical protein
MFDALQEPFLKQPPGSASLLVSNEQVDSLPESRFKCARV